MTVCSTTPMSPPVIIQERRFVDRKSAVSVEAMLNRPLTNAALTVAIPS